MLNISDTFSYYEYNSYEFQIRQHNAFLLVYDITSFQSFKRISHIYNKIGRIKECDFDKIVIVLIGNKCDLYDQRKVDYEKGKQLVYEWNNEGVKSIFFETSVKECINTKQCFLQIVKLLKSKERVEESEEERCCKDLCQVL